MKNSEYVALLGGSFNPPHIGHFRMALEVFEAICPDRLEFIPCANPPHKTSRNLLPFDMRVALLESVLLSFPAMSVNQIEVKRSGPSYTVHTLEALRQENPAARFGFIMGAGDFFLLTTWHEWERLPALADLIILPRDGAERDLFIAHARKLWSALDDVSYGENEAATFTFPHGGRLLYLPQPRLEVSSSLVRERWLQQRSLDFLVPPEVIQALSANAQLIRQCWE